MRHYNIPIFIPHLGCPFRCIFCNQNTIASQQKVPQAEDVVNLVEEYLKTIPGTEDNVEIAFFGGSFTAIEKQMQEEYLHAVNPYLKSGRVKGIRISTRPDCIDEEILELLAGWGVKTIELGVQSLDDEVLKASRRGYQASDVFKACDLIKKRKFKLGIQLMIGLPGDSCQKDMDTTNQVISIHPDMVRIYPTLVIAGTYLETLYNKGTYRALGLKEAIEISKNMLLSFQKVNINVIRIGLQPSEDLRSEGTVAAGPFHPSFGELVEQAIFREQAELAINKLFVTDGIQDKICLYINKHDISKMVGCRRANLVWLKNKFDLMDIKVKEGASLEKDWVGVSGHYDTYPSTVISRTDLINFGTIK